MMKARERLWLTADGAALVPDGSARAAKLYAAEGDEIPDSAAAMFGVVDGRIAEAPAKRRKGGEDKRRKDGADKQDKGGQNKDAPVDDLTQIKGIGPATARALATAGLGTFEALSGVHAEAPPPDTGIKVTADDWRTWKAEAYAIHQAISQAPSAQPVSGLTVKTLKKED